MPRPELSLAAAMLAVFAGMVALASTYAPAARLMPLAVGVPALLLAAWELQRTWRSGDGRAPVNRSHGRQSAALTWFAAFVLAIVVGGFVVGGVAAVVVAQRFWLRESWPTACLGGLIALLLLAGGIERGLGQPLFEGVLTGWARGWLGI